MNWNTTSQPQESGHYVVSIEFRSPTENRNSRYMAYFDLDQRVWKKSDPFNPKYPKDMDEITEGTVLAWHEALPVFLR